MFGKCLHCIDFNFCINYRNMLTRKKSELMNSTLKIRSKVTEFANSIDPDEVAHNEPPHLDLDCLPSNL